MLSTPMDKRSSFMVKAGHRSSITLISKFIICQGVTIPCCFSISQWCWQNVNILSDLPLGVRFHRHFWKCLQFCCEKFCPKKLNRNRYKSVWMNQTLLYCLILDWSTWSLSSSQLIENSHQLSCLPGKSRARIWC